MATIGIATTRLDRNVENGPSLFNELETAYRIATYEIDKNEYRMGDENG